MFLLLENQEWLDFLPKDFATGNPNGKGSPLRGHSNHGFYQNRTKSRQGDGQFIQGIIAFHARLY